LKRRCEEAIDLECGECGGLVDWNSEGQLECSVCLKVDVPRQRCSRCKELLDSVVAATERDCLSAQAYGKHHGSRLAPFAPSDEPIWAFKDPSGAIQIATEEALRNRFAAGELAETTEVSSPQHDTFRSARASREFGAAVLIGLALIAERAEQQRAEQLRKEQLRKEQEQVEQLRRAQERAAQEQTEQLRREQERAAQERAERQRTGQQRAEQQRPVERKKLFQKLLGFSIVAVVALLAVFIFRYWSIEGDYQRAVQLSNPVSANRDDKEAVRLLHLATARGHVDAHYLLGMMRESGRGGLATDLPEAKRLYQIAASGGNAAAQSNLTRLETAAKAKSGVCTDIARCLNDMLAASFPLKADALERSVTKALSLNVYPRGVRKPQGELTQKGIEAFNSADYATAARFFLQAVEADQSEPQLWLNLGIAYVKGGRLDSADGVLLRALALNPRAPNLWELYSEFFSLKNNQDFSVKSLLLSYQYSTNRAATYKYYQDRATKETRLIYKQAYQRALEIISKGSFGYAAP
jgi:TPR repeat protein